MDLPDFNPERAHQFMQGVYGNFLNHNGRLQLDEGVTDDNIWNCRWRRLATQLASWYAMSSGTIGRRFTAILDAEWRGVLGRTWNSERPLAFTQVVLTKTIGVCRTRDIRTRIIRQMDL